MQSWFLIYLALWSSAVVIYGLVFYLLNAYEQPLRIIFVYLAALGALSIFFSPSLRDWRILGVVVSYLVIYGSYGVLNFTSLYIPLLAAVKFLDSLRSVAIDLACISSLVRYRPKPDDTPARVKEITESRQVYRAFIVSVLNKFFLVNMGRVLLALVWAVTSFILAVFMRPFIGNRFLFGRNAGSKNYSFLKSQRKMRARKKRFGLIV